MNLFIIGSPFQLLSAISAKNKFNSKHNTLIVRYSSNDKNNDQLRRLIELEPWDKVIEIQKSLFNILYFLWIIRKYSKSTYYFEHLFVGDVRIPENLLALENINNNQSYLLDDGGVTITVQNVFFENLDKLNVGYLSKFRLLRKQIYRIMRLNMYFVKQLDLFTCFELSPRLGQKIVFNDFSYIRGKLNLKNSASDKNVIYFLGTSMVENRFISLDYYYKIMNQINIYYKKLNKKILYIPHRIESSKKLSVLTNENFELLRFDNPVELEFIYRNINPINVASFFSTALYTLKIIYNPVSVDAFMIDFNEISSKQIEHVAACYKFNAHFVNEISI